MSDAVDQIDVTSACRTGAVKPTSSADPVFTTDARLRSSAAISVVVVELFVGNQGRALR